MAENQYTSDSEFDLVTRVQITNEVPPVSPWNLMPSGLQNEFWKYIVGHVTTREFEGFKPTKTVNGVEAPIYGPDIDSADYSSFQSLEIDGVIAPELDFMLHEMYRYLGSYYPNHPDFAQLLTAVELDDAFLSITGLIDYAPDYSFLPYWSASHNGIRNTREETKWKIRDLRSYAYKRKFAGSYIGYKMIAGTLGKHCSIYNTATYSALDDTETSVDLSNGLTGRDFRFLDYYGINEAAQAFTTDNVLTYSVMPHQDTRMYILESSFDIQQDSIAPDRVFNTIDTLLGYTVQRGQERTTLSTEDAYLPYVELSTALFTKSSPFAVRTITTPHDVDLFSLNLYVDPIELGIFRFDYIEAMKLYYRTAPGLEDVKPVKLKESLLVCTDSDRLVPFTYGAIIDAFYEGIVELDTTNASSLSGISASQTVYLKAPALLYTGEKSTYLRGTLDFEKDSVTEKITRATFKIVSIPDELPGVEDNRESIANSYRDPFHAGTSIDICIEGKDGLECVSTCTIDSIQWGYYSTTSVIPDPKTGFLISANQLFLVKEPEMSEETSQVWLKHGTQEATIVPVQSSDIEIGGTTYSTDSYEIDIDTSASSYLSYFSPGNSVRGKGIPSGTYIKEIRENSIVISEYPQLIGSIVLTITCYTNPSEISNPIQFRSKLQYPTNYYDRANVFRGLWPSSKFPNTSLGYIEGVNNLSALSEMYETTYNSLTASHRIDLTNTLHVECSLDSVLYHANSVSATSYGLSNTCLIDTPWLDYLTASIDLYQRAGDKVRVGSQLTMMTDTSGLYTSNSDLLYTDPTIQSQFVVFPANYNTDSEAAYVRFGTGGFSEVANKVFLNPKDLVRPSFFGDAIYDQNQVPVENFVDGKRNVFTNVENIQAANTADEEIEFVEAFSGVEDPVFEVPLTEYESFMLKDLNHLDNDYHVIQTSVYEEVVSGSSLETALKVNTVLRDEGFVSLEEDGYRYLGTFVPTVSRTNSSEIIYPTIDEDSIEPGTYPYYIVPEEIVAVRTKFNKGDWIIYDPDLGWQRRAWQLLDVFGDGSSSTVTADSTSQIEIKLRDYVAEIIASEAESDGSIDPTPPFTDLYTYLNNNIVYYVAANDVTFIRKVFIEDGRIQEVPVTVKQDEWIVLTKELAKTEGYKLYTVEDEISGPDLLEVASEETDEDGNAVLITDSLNSDSPLGWNVIQGNSYDNLRQPFYRGNLSTEDFSSYKERRVKLLEDIIFSQKLSRRFISQGTVDCNLLYRFPLRGRTEDGVLYQVTESAINFDTDVNKFYTQSANGAKNYIGFGEPVWYKNLFSITGTVHKDNKAVLQPVPGVNDFDLSKLQEKDSVIHSKAVAIRDMPGLNKDCFFYSHYVDMQGVLEDGFEYEVIEESTDAEGNDIQTVVKKQGIKLSPATEGKYPIVNEENFRRSLRGIANDDSVVRVYPAFERKYRDEYENKYFKNLLTISGKVTKAEPYTIQAASAGADDRNALLEAVRLAKIGDRVVDIYCIDGTTLSFGRSSIFNDVSLLHTAHHMLGAWVVAGEDGFIAYTEQTVDAIDTWYTDGWKQTILDAEAAVAERITSLSSASLESKFLAGTESGKIYESEDRGQTWSEFISARAAIEAGGIGEDTTTGDVKSGAKIVAMRESTYETTSSSGDEWATEGLDRAQTLFITEGGLVGVYNQRRQEVVNADSDPNNSDWLVYTLPSSYTLEFPDGDVTTVPDADDMDEETWMPGWIHGDSISYPRDLCFGEDYWIIVGDNGLMSKAHYTELKKDPVVNVGVTANPGEGDPMPSDPDNPTDSSEAVLGRPFNPFEFTGVMSVVYDHLGETKADFAKWVMESSRRGYTYQTWQEAMKNDPVAGEVATNIVITSGIAFSDVTFSPVEKVTDTGEDLATEIAQDGTWIVVGYKFDTKESIILRSTSKGEAWDVVQCWTAEELKTFTSSDIDSPHISKVTADNGEWFVYGPNLDRILTSVDGGLTWTVKEYSQNNAVGVSQIAVNGSGTRMYTGSFDSRYFPAGSTSTGVVDKLMLSVNNVKLNSLDVRVSQVSPNGDLQIVLDSKIIEDTRWLDPGSEDHEEKVILISLDTSQAVAGYNAIASSRFKDFLSSTGTLVVRDCLAVSSATKANRIYLPRTNSQLATKEFEVTDVSGVTYYTENRNYIGKSGYPLSDEGMGGYHLSSTGDTVDFLNGSSQIIYMCNEDGRYIDNSHEDIDYESFVDPSSTSSTIVPLVDIRVAADYPLYNTYNDWLLQGNDIVADYDSDILEGFTSKITVIHNEDSDGTEDTLPYCVIDGSLDAYESELAIEGYDSLVLKIVPAEPVLILRQDAPSYMTDEDGANKGLQAVNLNGTVYYSLAPMTNEKFIPDGSLLADTVGDNTGLGVETDVMSEDEEAGLLDSIYTLSPIRQLQSPVILTEDGTLLTTQTGVSIDGKTELRTVITVQDTVVTGVYFPPAGYGSWIGIPSVVVKDEFEDRLLPWENDPSAFYSQPVYDEDGNIKEGEISFIYMINTYGEVLHLCDRDGTLIKTEEGHAIPVPALKNFLYEDFILEHGVVGTSSFLNRNLPLEGADEMHVLTDDGSSTLTLSRDIVRDEDFAEGETEMNVQLILLTALNVDSTDLNCTDPAFRYKLAASDLYKFDPDRVSYDEKECLYPTIEEQPLMWDTSRDYTNKEGFNIYRCNAEGDYVYVDDAEELKSITQKTFTNRETVIAPLYVSCQQWYETEFHSETSPSNPYWQWINISERVDANSKQSTQHIAINRLHKHKGSLVEKEVTGTDESYLDITNPFKITETMSSVTTQDVDIIDHANGTISFVASVRDFGVVDALDAISQTLTASAEGAVITDEMTAEEAEQALLEAERILDKSIRDAKDIYLNQVFRKYGMVLETPFGEAFPNSLYDPNAVEGSKEAEPYTDLYQITAPLQGNISSDWNLNYNLNSLRSFRSKSSTDSIVAIKEVGVYNKQDQIIAYGRFPAVIYDSTKNHFSVNLFIKQGTATMLT